MPLPKTKRVNVLPIKGASRYTVDRQARVRNVNTGKLIPTQTSKHGALKVNLVLDAGYRTTLVLARVIGEAFCPAFRRWLRPKHKNGKKHDCRPSNLLWVPVRAVSVAPVGAARCTAKLTEEKVDLIRRSTLSARELAGNMGVTSGHIYDIRAGRAWGHSVNPTSKVK
jgi:hypothetical protein